MPAPSHAPADRGLVDEAARCAALATLDRSMLVEAGAGSGKTAILAGRIASLLAKGVAPRHIAAVTFTELAASELLSRVREYAAELGQGTVPPALRGVFPDGPSAADRQHLAAANAAIDEITCTTIHGFCERLIAPYPVEADMDPGARVMDRDEMDLVFGEVAESWLHERLSAEHGELLDELVKQRPCESVELVRQLLEALRRHRNLIAPPVSPLSHHIADFRREVTAFSALFERAAIPEAETAAILTLFRVMSESIGDSPHDGDFPALIRVLTWAPHPDLCREDGAFKVFRKKGKWAEAAKRAGIGKADGERLYQQAEEAYRACCASWTRLQEQAAGTVLAGLIAELRPVVRRFQDYKRSAALLDFDDLLHTACALLRDHEEVRRALARRYAHVLVDEFQDTDLLQIEILWRLCGELAPGAAGSRWIDYRIRPGALFLVGDPKQAIYRFRGADVAAYLQARDIFRAHGAGHVIPISTNFRSCEPILTYVNGCFGGPLSAPGQPGFTPLDPCNAAREDGPCVAALDVQVADEEGKASSERQRRAEADAVARLCSSLIGRKGIIDRQTGIIRPCRAGDIALLAPAGTELWCYEEALEQHGIPVTTQAGKGLFRRQEIQDLIAVTRVLADPRDTLALGALLRGPLVGLTEEQLLDIVSSLPRQGDDDNRPRRLDVHVDPREISHPLARDILTRLQSLRRQVDLTSPHAILTQAVDALCVRPILRERHRRPAGRALANIDLYLDLSRAYAVRGMRAFAHAMTAAWSDELRAVEGRPDAQEDGVTLQTMHAAKGLEWPVVIPINAMTITRGPESVLIDRGTGQLYCPVFGVSPAGYEAARETERTELERERIRLWYVALTRAREMLIIPRLDVSSPATAWISAIDLSLDTLPAADVAQLGGERVTGRPPEPVTQSREAFEREASAIRERERSLIWVTPSVDEEALAPDGKPESPSVVVAGEGVSEDRRPPATIRGGRDRGVIIHKLLEEVLTGEITDDPETIVSRAEALVRTLGARSSADPAQTLSAAEIGSCVTRTLALPRIAALRPTLIPEVPVYALVGSEGGGEQVIVGIVDALSVGADGSPRQIIDWKSDVEPTAEALASYRAQMAAYLTATGVEVALLVFVTSGTVIPIKAGAPPPCATPRRIRPARSPPSPRRDERTC